MAQQIPPPRVYSPIQSTPSPGATSAGGFLPPNKRQRLSPNPPSPYTTNPNSPNIPNISLPAAPTPLNATPVNGASAMAPPTGSMGPPSRPVDKATDLNELGDVIASSGIDIKDEEAALYHSYFTGDQPSSSFTSNNASFNSTGTAGSQSSALSPSNSFAYSQPIQAGPQQFYGAGPLSQPAAPPKSAEEIANEEWKRKIRQLSERRQHHLNEPFLYTNTLRHKIGRRTYDSGVRMPMEGLYDPLPAKPPRGPSSTTITGSDGTSIKSVKGPSLLNDNAPLVDILSLLSLACNERIRGIVEDAHALAKGRRVGSHGVVPPDWADLAIGPGAEAPTAVAAANKMVPLKRSHSSANRLPTPSSSQDMVASPSPIKTISFPNEIAKALRALAQKDRQHEEERLAHRAARASRASSTPAPAAAPEPGSKPDGATTAPSSAAPSTPGTPASGGGLLGERAPEVKMTKKERDKLLKAGASEANQHASANVTANMALGSGLGGGVFGKKKGAYSWMQKSSNASSPGRLNTALGSGTGLGSGGGSGGSDAFSGSSSAAGGAGTSLLPPHSGRRFGEFREDREKGAGIQLRDVVSVLEADGKEKKSLAWVYTRMKD